MLCTTAESAGVYGRDVGDGDRDESLVVVVDGKEEDEEKASVEWW